MRLGNRRRLPLAVVGVGLAIAAADRAEDLWTNFRHSHAGTRRVGDVALPGFILAEQAGIALNADDGAALFPGADRVAPVGTEIINVSAAAIETNSPVFIMASLDEVLLDNHRLHLSRKWWNDCEMDYAGCSVPLARSSANCL